MNGKEITFRNRKKDKKAAPLTRSRCIACLAGMLMLLLCLLPEMHAQAADDDHTYTKIEITGPKKLVVGEPIPMDNSLFSVKLTLKSGETQVMPVTGVTAKLHVKERRGKNFAEYDVTYTQADEIPNVRKLESGEYYYYVIDYDKEGYTAASSYEYSYNG